MKYFSPSSLGMIPRYGGIALSLLAATYLAQREANAQGFGASPNVKMSSTTQDPDFLTLQKLNQNINSTVQSRTSHNADYLAQIKAALPSGVTLAQATPEQIAAAIAQVILANKATPNAVVEIVAAAVKAVQPTQVVAVAAGVAKAFAEAPALATEAPKVTKVLAQELAAKEGNPKELGTALGNATAEIVKALDKSNTALITDTVTSALTAAPALDFTAAAYETVMETIRQIDTGNVIEDKVTQNVIENVSREIAEQIIPNVDGQAPDAKTITDNQTQQPNNIENTGDRPIESATTPL